MINNLKTLTINTTNFDFYGLYQFISGLILYFVNHKHFDIKFLKFNALNILNEAKLDKKFYKDYKEFKENLYTLKANNNLCKLFWNEKNFYKIEDFKDIFYIKNTKLNFYEKIQQQKIQQKKILNKYIFRFSLLRIFINDFCEIKSNISNFSQKNFKIITKIIRKARYYGLIPFSLPLFHQVTTEENREIFDNILNFSDKKIFFLKALFLLNKFNKHAVANTFMEYPIFKFIFYKKFFLVKRFLQNYSTYKKDTAIKIKRQERLLKIIPKLSKISETQENESIIE